MLIYGLGLEVVLSIYDWLSPSLDWAICELLMSDSLASSVDWMGSCWADESVFAFGLALLFLDWSEELDLLLSRSPIVRIEVALSEDSRLVFELPLKLSLSEL